MKIYINHEKGYFYVTTAKPQMIGKLFNGSIDKAIVTVQHYLKDLNVKLSNVITAIQNNLSILEESLKEEKLTRTTEEFKKYVEKQAIEKDFNGHELLVKRKESYLTKFNFYRDYLEYGKIAITKYQALGHSIPNVPVKKLFECKARVVKLRDKLMNNKKVTGFVYEIEIDPKKLQRILDKVVG